MPPGFTAESWAAVEKHISDTYEEDGSKKEQPPNDGTKPHHDFAHPMQPVYLDNGVPRFKPNQIVRALLDTGKLDMNDLARLEFSREDREQFAQLIGYSVSGFGELSYTSDMVYDVAMSCADKLLDEKK